MSDYGIIAQILDDRYKTEAAMNPYLAAAGGMGESMPAYTGNKWWEGLAQGLLYGGTKGFLMQKGKNDLDAQSAEEEARAARFTKLWSDDPENPEVQAMMATKDPVINKLASRLELLKASEEMSNRSSGRNPVPAEIIEKRLAVQLPEMGPDERKAVVEAYANEPEYVVKAAIEQIVKTARGDPELMKKRAAAQAAGTLGGKEGFRGDRGYLSDDAGKAVTAAMTELKSHQVARDYNNLETAYRKAQKLGNTGIGDYLTQVLVVKQADPGTAAREGEVAAVKEARKLLDKWKGLLESNVNGTGVLTDANRAEILQAMKIFRDVGARAYNETVLRPNIDLVREKGGLSALAGFTPAIPAEYMAEYKPLYDDVKRAVIMQQEGKLEDLQALSNMYMNKGIDQMFNPSDMAAAIAPETTEKMVTVEDKARGIKGRVPISVAREGEAAILRYLGSR